MALFDPTRPDFAPYGFTCVRWTPALMKRPDRHDEVELNLLESGHLTYLLGGERVTVQPGRLSIFWAAFPHQVVEIGNRRAYLVATLPLAWFMQCGLPSTFVQLILNGRLLCDEPAPDDWERRLFERWVADANGRSPERKRAVLLEIEARLLRFATDLSGRRRNPGTTILGAADQNKAESMATFVARRYTGVLRVADIAAAVRLHPNYAMTLFKRVFGISLVEYVTRHRVAHAQRMLVTGDEKVASIARASGFHSLSRFNDAFRNICMCAPNEYRRQGKQ
jgi:AraC family transcriptional regulator, melibiose operon regulatory protein